MRQPLDQWRSQLLWVSVALYLEVLFQSWRSLPPRLAIHFSATGAVNGTETRASFAVQSLLILVVMVLVLSLVARHEGRNTRALRISQYAFSYAIIGFISAVNIALIQYNLHGGTLANRLSIYATSGVLCAALGVAVGLSSPCKRHSVAASAEGAATLGRQVHRSPLQTAILGIVVAVLAALWIGLSFTRMPIGAAVPIRMLVAIPLMILGYFATLTTMGFRYLVSPTELQINWGFRRMEVIPASLVEAISIEPAHPVRDFGGWGARWSGNNREYFLKGKTAVRVKTSEGDIFLGSNHPDALLSLLRRMNASPSP